MDFWQGLTLLTCIHVLAALSPGPDIALLTRQSLVHGRAAGIWTSLGISLGLSIHILYSIAGLAAIIAHSVQWMILVKLAGGCYLVFLGIGGLRSQQQAQEQLVSAQGPQSRGPYRYLVMGLLCNALNPKAVVYFLSLFTVILSPDLPVPVLLAYGAWIIFLQLCCFVTLAYLFTHNAIHNRFTRIGHWIDRVFGIAMIALGIKVLISES